MSVVAIIGQTSGPGKTTVAIALAVQAAKTRPAVAVVDVDPQAKAANWKDCRTADDMVVLAAPATRVAAALALRRRSLSRAPLSRASKSGAKIDSLYRSQCRPQPLSPSQCRPMREENRYEKQQARRAQTGA
jgi:chromosome partitioning protein